MPGCVTRISTGRGTELSPFFYADDKRTTSSSRAGRASADMRLELPAADARGSAPRAARRRRGAATLARERGRTPTHFQQNISDQIIDRGLTGVVIGSGQLADLGVISAPIHRRSSWSAVDDRD